MRGHGVQASDVVREVERAQVRELGHVGTEEADARDAGLPSATSRPIHRQRGEVDPDDLPAPLCEVDRVRAGAAAEVDRASWRRSRDEVDQLRRRDAGVPPGPAEPVQQLEEQPLPHTSA